MQVERHVSHLCTQPISAERVFFPSGLSPYGAGLCKASEYMQHFWRKRPLARILRICTLPRSSLMVSYAFTQLCLSSTGQGIYSSLVRWHIQIAAPLVSVLTVPHQWNPILPGPATSKSIICWADTAPTEIALLPRRRGMPFLDALMYRRARCFLPQGLGVSGCLDLHLSFICCLG